MKKKNLKMAVIGTAVLVLVCAQVTAFASSGDKNLKAIFQNIKVVINGKMVATEAEPFIVDGVTYLPVRDVAEALNMDVSWDNKTKTVTLSDNANSGGTEDTGVPSGNNIGESKAKEIALRHAKLTASNVTFIKSQLDTDDGRVVYDVEFYSGNREYDYEIDAVSGKVLSYDAELEDFSIPSSDKTGTYISEAKAKEIALEKQPGSTIAQIKLDTDDGRTVYEGKSYKGNMEYEFEIDAVTGKILNWEQDIND